MPFCPNCGALYNEGDAVCSQCKIQLSHRAPDDTSEGTNHRLKRFEYFLSFLGSPWGVLAGGSLVLPFVGWLTDVMEIPTDLKSISRVMAFVACSFAILLSYTKRESLWKYELMRRVRGVRRIGINIVAILFLLGALLSWGGELAVSREYAQSEHLERQFLIPAIYCLALGGITASLSLLASLSCMKRLEEVKKYQRPEFLRDYADLVGIVTPQIKKDLNIPDEEPLKVVFRERRLAGGLRFTIRRREEVLKKTERGGFETIEEEKEYQIEVNERGNLVSLKERAEKM